jgi:hypothetical protein
LVFGSKSIYNIDLKPKEVAFHKITYQKAHPEARWATGYF